MPYTKQTWADGEAGGTPITAARLNAIETGIDTAHDTADAAETPAGAQAKVDVHAAETDPHAQYHTDARGDARYYTQAQVDTSLAAKQSTAEKGAANGYASLGADGKVPSAQLPATSSVTANTQVVTTTESTTSTTATDLATVGPAATVTVGASGKVLVTIHSLCWASTANTSANVWIAVSGANTMAASSPYVISGVSPSLNTGPSYSGTFLFTGLAAGSTTFTLKYSTASGTGSFARRIITATAV